MEEGEEMEEGTEREDIHVPSSSLGVLAKTLTDRATVFSCERNSSLTLGSHSQSMKKSYSLPALSTDGRDSMWVRFTPSVLREGVRE